MAINPTLSLDTGWHCRYEPASGEGSQPEATFLTALTTWDPAEAPREGWLVCSRSFWLDPVDGCVRYFLTSSRFPHKGEITVAQGPSHVRGEAGPLALDVTDHVALEENRIRLRLKLDQIETGERLAPLTLEAVPCDS